ncbi:MAG: hypothetical protein PVH91_09420 [Pseudomonadales bacterium]|jgi:hypothetical protein
MKPLVTIGALTLALAPYYTWAGSSCPGPFDEQHLVLRLPDEQPDAAGYGIYAEQCDGGLYLVNPVSGERLTRINETWWLEAFESAQWASDDHEAIVVLASYITGIGPTGVQPFQARIVVTRTPQGWLPGEPQFPDEEEPAADPPDDADPMDRAVREAGTPEAFAALELTSHGRPVDLHPDFATSRVVLKSLWLTSGSIYVKQVAVHRQDDRYVVYYDVTTPEIGTADMKQCVLYAVLPDDGLPVTFEKRHTFGRPGRSVPDAGGVLDGASFAGAPTP